MLKLVLSCVAFATFAAALPLSIAVGNGAAIIDCLIFLAASFTLVGADRAGDRS